MFGGQGGGENLAWTERMQSKYIIWNFLNKKWMSELREITQKRNINVE